VKLIDDFDTPPSTLEACFAFETIERYMPDKTYRLNNNHIKSREHSTNSEFPCVNFGARDILWDAWDNIPDGYLKNDESARLDEIINDRFYEEINCINEMLESEGYDFEITTCLNGYNIIGLIPINELLEERHSNEEEIRHLKSLLEKTFSREDLDDEEKEDERENIEERIEEIENEIEYIDQKIVREAPKLIKFQEIVEKWLKQAFKDHIIVRSDDGEGYIDWIDKEYFLSEKEEQGFVSLSEEHEIDYLIERITLEEAKESIQESAKQIKGFKAKKEGWEKAINSLRVEALI